MKENGYGEELEIIKEGLFIGILFIFFLISLIFESFGLNQARKRLKWRLAVGGTRGKSSVTRLIAGALREAGLKVMARTTGSSARVIFPDGHEEAIKRRGLANILEGKKFLRLVNREKAEALVVELMAIKPECLEAEIKGIFRPHGLVLTNFRPDHVEELGRSRQEVAENILRTIEQDTTVFLLEEEILPEIKSILRRKKINLILVPSENKFFLASSNLPSPSDEFNSKNLRAKYGDDFLDNIRLALAVTRFIGIEDKIALSGMKKVTPDLGSLKIWQINLRGRSLGYAVSAFAANDPFSSSLTMRKIKELIPFEGKSIYGLLLFRRDRGDRTQQWLQAIKEGFFAGFAGLFLYNCPIWSFVSLRKRVLTKKIDLHGKADFINAKKGPLKWNNFERWPQDQANGKKIEKKEDRGESWQKENQDEENFSLSPEIKRLKKDEVLNLVEILSQKEDKPWVLIGLGNIVGLGTQLIDLWEKRGQRIHG